MSHEEYYQRLAAGEVVKAGDAVENDQWVFPPNAADLSGWRDAFLEAGAASLKSRPRDDRDASDRQLQAKLGEVTMDNELLEEKIERMEAGRPFVHRRSKR